MDINQLECAAEAILFASGEPVSISRIAQTLEIDDDTANLRIQHVSDKLCERKSALCIIKLDDKYQMCAKSEYMPYIRKTLDLRRNSPLSQAALEVLAVISYNQPVTKAFVEQVRGVDCSGVFTTLCEKGLIEEKGRLELPGRPLIYGTTDNFLRCFNLSSIDNLPPLPDNNTIQSEDDDNDED